MRLGAQLQGRETWCQKVSPRCLAGSDHPQEGSHDALLQCSNSSVPSLQADKIKLRDDLNLLYVRHISSFSMQNAHSHNQDFLSAHPLSNPHPR